MNKIIRFVLRGLLALLVLIFILALICFKPLDDIPYQQTDFYKKELTIIKDYKLQISKFQTDKSDSSSTLEVGWSKMNLLPSFTTPIAIDAHRGGKHFEGVHDSIYVRAFVFKKGATKVAYVSMDMLIVPPTVADMFDTLMMANGFDRNNVYFTATHTHTSIGAWHNSYVGEIFAGKYDERVPKHVVACISKAILDAEKNCSLATIGYGQFPTHQLVYNRLVKEKGDVDSLLRIIKIVKQTGEKAAIITFAAHATVFHENLMKISADWPGLMMHELEKSGKVDFASFSAGAVGSQGPFEFSKDQEKEAVYMAEGVKNIVAEKFDSIMTNTSPADGNVKMQRLPLYLREPDLRVTPKIALRPWLFKRLFGDEPVFITTLSIGSVVWVGMPCDFSGELTDELSKLADKNGQKLVITSFNGGYIGYITRDKWYEMSTYETKIMGWFGPGNGNYFSEVIKNAISR